MRGIFDRRKNKIARKEGLVGQKKKTYKDWDNVFF